MKKVIFLFFQILFFFSIDAFSQDLSLVNETYQLSGNFIYVESAPSNLVIMQKFNRWLNKIDTVETLNQSSTVYNGVCRLNLNSNNIVKYNFDFSVTANSYNYKVHQIKYFDGSGNEINLENVPDQSQRTEILTFLNEHLSEITKTLNTELQDL